MTRDLTGFYGGKPIAYWCELERLGKKAADLNAEHLILEIADLRAKVNFYESRIKEMNVIMERKGDNDHVQR